MIAPVRLLIAVVPVEAVYKSAATAYNITGDDAMLYTDGLQEPYGLATQLSAAKRLRKRACCRTTARAQAEWTLAASLDVVTLAKP